VRADLERKREKRQLKEKRRLRRRRLRLGIAIAVFVLLSAGVGYYAATAWRSLGPRDPAPDFALPDQDGRTVRLADYHGKQEVALFFYMNAG
jgi:cytochrome oxidase Cu insertion factor (SCO1/SenC/PrrC family)